jgi:predicted small secreted protein
MKNRLKLMGFGVAAFARAACNTVVGVGQDIETAGDKIEKTADANK